MNRVISFIVKSSISNQWLANKVLQITRSSQRHLICNRYPSIILDNYEQLNQYVDQAEFLFVQSAGDYIIDADVIWEQLHNIPDDIGLIGHIIWHPHQITPVLHEQCFIIRTAALKNTQLDFNTTCQAGPNFIRSVEDMHIDHAPLWIKLGDLIGPREDGFGTGLMELILSNGYRVRNFDEHWRYSGVRNIPLVSDTRSPTRGYLYPNIETEVFAHCLKTLTLDHRLDEAHVLAINAINEVLKFNYINILHWDDVPTNQDVDMVIAPANGLMGESIALMNNAKKIIFYDINHNNIKFKQYLYEQFNGSNYIEFCQTYAETNNLKIEPAFDENRARAEKQMHNTNQVLSNWDNVKLFDREFVQGDLFEVIDLLLSKVQGKTILHTSTILGDYIFSNILYDEDQFTQVREKIQNCPELIWITER